MSNRTVQRILQETRRGQPIDSGVLRDMAVSAASAAQMVKSGWLERLSQGVYLLTGDTPSVNGCIAYRSHCIPGLHVGGGTALAWRAQRRVPSDSGKLALWGQASYRIPSWVALHVDYAFQTTNLFDESFVYEGGLAPFPARPTFIWSCWTRISANARA